MTTDIPQESDNDIVGTVDLTRFERNALAVEIRSFITACDRHSKSKGAHPKWEIYRENWKVFLAKLEGVRT